MDTQALVSELDASVNFITRGQFPGSIEARYVRRSDDYFIIYVSSQTGCPKACRFCHLTQTGQTAFVNVDLAGYFRQAEEVFAHYDGLLVDGGERARSVHVNFMARGEVFANPHVLEDGDTLVAGLAEMAVARGLVSRPKFSTIMPEEMRDVELTDVFRATAPDVYYSLYSVDPAFRRRWLPKAIEPSLALEKLVAYQQLTRKIPVLHWAFIEGENDSAESVEAITETVRDAGLHCDFNIVRYNPYSDRQGQEPAVEVLERNAQLLADGVPGSRVKIVGRVGFDVKASCGMFVPGPDRRGRIRQPALASQGGPE